MATLLEQAIKALRGLPDDEQNLAAAAVIDYARRDDELALADEDAAEVRRRLTSEGTLLSLDEVRARLDA
jgi:hypothetical protein